MIGLVVEGKYMGAMHDNYKSTKQHDFVAIFQMIGLLVVFKKC